MDDFQEQFDKRFFDARKHAIQPGQVMARYVATAEFIDGHEKYHLIDLLCNTTKAIPASQVMRKLLCSTELDSYRVPRQMAEDMASGLSREDCAKKPYNFTLEMFFYTSREYIPEDDPHWSCISVLNLDEFLDRKDDRIKTKILSPEEINASNTSKLGTET